MQNVDADFHVKGESVFIDDMFTHERLLHAVVFGSPVAHGRILSLDYQKALAAPGVVAVLGAKDIPGENQLGTIIADEPMLAEDAVHFIGDPILIVVAESRKQAETAIKLIEYDIAPLPVITDPRTAFDKGKLIAPPRTFLLGDPDAHWEECDYIIEGSAESEGQEHFYMEPQSAVAVPIERGGIKVHSSSQNPTGVQKGVAKILGLPMNRVEVDTRRLGGGFGGKEDQATTWATMCALPAFLLKRPVKIVLSRHADLVMTGKRHPYASDYKIGLRADGKILCYEVMFYQNSGAAADLSTSILERTLFHTTNSYFIPHVKATAVCCRTNLVPFTAFRGFGGPQAMFVLESAIYRASEVSGISAQAIQQINLLSEGDSFPYGQKAEYSQAKKCWQKADELYRFDGIYKEIETFNRHHSRYKKGVATMPICFGISFTAIHLNQARALVHVYNDGSVNVSTGAVEMGQGVNMKILQVAAHTLGINPSRVRVETTNTSRVANTAPTAASSGSDLNGMATQFACEDILGRLIRFAAERLGADHPDRVTVANETVYLNGEATDLDWNHLVHLAYFSRINLSSEAHYATPDLHFDKTTEKGRAFAYHVFGTAIIEATLDGLLGTYDISRVKLVHDCGKSINPLIDRGQIEGGLVQGIGWQVMESLTFRADGSLVNATADSYKIPDIQSIPDMEIHILEDVDNPHAVLHSKAVGEPPFMYGIGAYFALLNAMRAFRDDDKPLPFHSPLTPERVLMWLYGK